jgi:hypothetical protein
MGSDKDGNVDNAKRVRVHSCTSVYAFLLELGGEHSVCVTSCHLGKEKGEACVCRSQYGITRPDNNGRDRVYSPAPSIQQAKKTAKKVCEHTDIIARPQWWGTYSRVR